MRVLPVPRHLATAVLAGLQVFPQFYVGRPALGKDGEFVAMLGAAEEGLAEKG
jgi:hypothetical protein